MLVAGPRNLGGPAKGRRAVMTLMVWSSSPETSSGDSGAALGLVTPWQS
jgi:hypothetical protein